ncbi:MAG: hypothetical protein GY711_05285, partial [bacterium]|nr:hypothetical protein [bacterium]
MIVFHTDKPTHNGYEVLARILKGQLRRSDVAGPIDQNQMAVILPETNGQGAQTVADEVTSQLAEHGLKFDPQVFLYDGAGALGDDVDQSSSPPPTKGNGNGNGLPHKLNGAGPQKIDANGGHPRRHDGNGRASGSPSNGRTARASGDSHSPVTAVLSGTEGRVNIAARHDLDLDEVRAECGKRPVQDLRELCQTPLSFRRRAL